MKKNGIYLIIILATISVFFIPATIFLTDKDLGNAMINGIKSIFSFQDNVANAALTIKDGIVSLWSGITSIVDKIIAFFK